MDDGEGATASYMKGPAMARILCVDNYDSFVFTIVGYLRHLGAVVDVVRNDVVDPAWFEAGYDGVLISPGPGDPKSAGASLQTIADCAEHGIPMLGVCLGHQSLGELFGATVGHAPELMHGKTSVITHDGRGVFEGVPSPLTVTAGSDAASCACAGATVTAPASHSGQCCARAAFLRGAPVFTCFRTACPLRTLLRIILK